VKHSATASFWKSYRALPKPIRLLAKKNFNLLKSNPRHPSIRLKKVGELWSARVGIDHRAAALESDDGLT
jgi:mRNA-degrading endonuclease RelE of RelBE toxin-antitoxin system